MNQAIQLALDLESLSGQPHHVCTDRHGDVRVISDHMGNLDEHNNEEQPDHSALNRLGRDLGLLVIG